MRLPSREAKFLERIVNNEGFKADLEYVCSVMEMEPSSSK